MGSLQATIWKCLGRLPSVLRRWDSPRSGVNRCGTPSLLHPMTPCPLVLVPLKRPTNVDAACGLMWTHTLLCMHCASPLSGLRSA